MTTFTEEKFRPIAVGPRILARELCRSEAPRNRHDSPEFDDMFATLQHWNPDVTQGYAYKPDRISVVFLGETSMYATRRCPVGCGLLSLGPASISHQARSRRGSARPHYLTNPYEP